MTRFITFFENSGFMLNGKVTRDLTLLALSERQIEWLINLKIVVNGSSQFVFRVGRKDIHARHLVGFFSSENMSLQILPKIYNQDTPLEYSAESALTNLIFMLKKSWEVEVWTDREAKQSSVPESLIDAIVWVFATRMKKYISLGLKKNYKHVTDESAQVRGQMKFIGAIFEPRSVIRPICSWDEWSEDTPVNRALLGLTELLISRVMSQKLRITLQALAAKLKATVITTKNFQPLFVENPSFKNQNYTALIRISKIIAKNIHPSMADGKQENICIGFDMNHLFESYLYSILFRYKNLLGLKSVEYQTGKRLISHYFNTIDGAIQTVKLKNTFTDIMVTDHLNRKFIFDAKYKVLDNQSKALGISNSDIYQLTTYQRIHQISNQETFGILVFPKATTDFARYFRLNMNEDCWLACHSLDLMCDLTSSELQLIEGLKKTLLSAITIRAETTYSKDANS